MYYFSDAQYKNCKNFINLCYHELILESMLNDTFLQHHMGRVLVMELVDKKLDKLDDINLKRGIGIEKVARYFIYEKRT